MCMDSSRETRWSELSIVCPSCGNRGEESGKWKTNAPTPFKIVEWVLRSFEFSADLDDERKLSIMADVQTDEVDWDSGAELRIKCMACFREFPIPDHAEIDFA